MFMKSNDDPKQDNVLKHMKDAAVPFCQCLKGRKELVAGLCYVSKVTCFSF